MSGAEGLVALSIVCNILQVIDFALEISKKTQEIYEKESHLTDDHDVMRSVAAGLSSRCRHLDDSLAQYGKTALEDRGSDDAELDRIARLCRGKADELTNVLRRIAPSNPDSRRSRFAAVVKALRESKSIETINRHMREYRDQTEFVMTHSS